MVASLSATCGNQYSNLRRILHQSRVTYRTLQRISEVRTDANDKTLALSFLLCVHNEKCASTTKNVLPQRKKMCCHNEKMKNVLPQRKKMCCHNEKRETKKITLTFYHWRLCCTEITFLDRASSATYFCQAT